MSTPSTSETAFSYVFPTEKFSSKPSFNKNAGTFDLRGAWARVTAFYSPTDDGLSSSSSEETIGPSDYFSGTTVGPSCASSWSDDDTFDEACPDDICKGSLYASDEHTASNILTSGDITYTVHGMLAKGGFGHVVYAHSSLGEQVAIKICSKAATKAYTAAQLRDIVINERDVLVKTTSGDHPFLTQPLACFQDADNVYFVMSMYAQNLAQLIFPADAQPLMPQQLKLFAAELLLGLQSLHELGIVHRDLKPENVLVTPNGHIAVADFGLAKQFSDGPVCPEMEMFECLGTPGYFAPEVMSCTPADGYTGAVDIWGYGIIVMEMALGRRCVDGDGRSYKNMKLAERIHEDIEAGLGDIDDLTADFLHMILQADASRRPSWAAIQQHPYFSGVDWANVKAREAKGDVHLPPVQGLKPFLPGMAADGMKFEVSDESLSFESDSSDRPYSTAIHGTAFVISSDRYANILS